MSRPDASPRPRSDGDPGLPARPGESGPRRLTTREADLPGQHEADLHDGPDPHGPHDPAPAGAPAAISVANPPGNPLENPPERRAVAPAAHERDDAGADARIGTRLGAWRIERRIGRGDFSTVYQACRDDGEYQQRVALKCIHAQWATSQWLAAFHDERNRLAQLDHPGIAGVIDGGVGADGQPWFAMRLVDGIALDRWCDRRRAGVRERVGLLIQVCEALADAHAQGVAHRDIKPSNLRVTHDGRVQLLDFGIAPELLARAARSRAHATHYAAPEAQTYRTGAMAADVYSLGVLGYRLLSAQWPRRSHAALADTDADADADAATMDRLLAGRGGRADLIARQRGLRNAAALRRVLAGDLSAIVRKAVARRPQDRYGSVQALADDLRRWCDQRPLAADPGDWRSRAQKWRRRNPAATGLIAALLLSVGIGLGALWWQQQRSRNETEAAHSVGELFASMLGSAALPGLGRAPFSSQALLHKTEQALERLPLERQPQLHAHSLATLARGYAAIGDYRRAGPLAERAQAVLDGRPDPDGFVIATRLSTLNRLGRYDEAMRIARARLDSLDPDDTADASAARLSVGAELAQAQWGLDQPEAALETANALLARAQTAPAQPAEAQAHLLILRADFLSRLARPAAAEADARRAIALARPVNPILADDALEALMRIAQAQADPDARALARELVQRRTLSLGLSHPKTAYAIVQLSAFPDSELSQAQVAAAQASTGAADGADGAR